MTDHNDIERFPIGYLLFKKVMIHDANSLSSPITYGFPNITGFLGAFHALGRKVQSNTGFDGLSLGGVLLACHDCQPQVYRTSRYSNYTFNQTRNPIKKDGKTAPIIEEGKCHVTMTFVVEVLAEDELNQETQNHLIDKTTQWVQQQRIAGGSVQGLARHDPVSFVSYEEADIIIPQLMPAFVLMDAQQDFVEIFDELQKNNPHVTPLDALLDISTIHHIPSVKNNGEVTWHNHSVKTGRGWLVPMPIGYQGISAKFDAGVMQNVRNPEYPSQYVEAVYGLGKWLYPHHLKGGDTFKNAFWRYDYQYDDTTDSHLYLTTQTNPFGF